MNLNAGYKNNNNDDDEDDNEEDGDDVTDDEPDFMDNSGKCWEFASKIEDEKHLKEWCQNKMGGMIVGKEEKLARQFHCPIKECQFKAIFLKSCSIIYTRNKHNHGMENVRNIQRKRKEEKVYLLSSANEQDYVDHQGKLWAFRAHIGKNFSPDIFRTKFGFSDIKRNETTLNLYCRKTNPTGGFCQFAGIYLKSNGCLYTRREHEHTKKGKTPQNVGEDYMDILGQIWKFYKEMDKKDPQEMLHSQFDFGTIRKNESGMRLQCQKKGPNGTCKFAVIYLKSNGCLYTRGKHTHIHLDKNPKPKVGDDYVDHLGKVWPFHSKIGKKHIPIQNGIWQNKFGFTTIRRLQLTFNLYCQKRINNGKKCPIKGIYIKENGCLYIRGKHKHK